MRKGKILFFKYKIRFRSNLLQSRRINRKSAHRLLDSDGLPLAFLVLYVFGGKAGGCVDAAGRGAGEVAVGLAELLLEVALPGVIEQVLTGRSGELSALDE